MSILNFKSVIYIGFVVLSIIHIISIKNNNKTCRVATKILIIPTLLIIYLINVNTPNMYLISGLAFGFLGDVFLISSNKKFFITGLFSFLIGHIFYIITFLNDIYFVNMPFYLFFLLILYVFCDVLVYKEIMPYVKSMKKPAFIYLIVITSMSFFSLMRINSSYGYRFWLPFLGSVLFILSDSMLAYNKFIKKNKEREIFVMITYILAQTLIMLGYI